MQKVFYDRFHECQPKAWDKQAESQLAWSTPLIPKLSMKLKRKVAGSSNSTPVDDAWLGDVKIKILCLASAGGQQAPVLAAAGANVTVFDFSQKQLEQDKMVAERDNLTLEIVQGDMRSLHMFADESFDIIFHPISNLYIPDVNPVWQECYRVLNQMDDCYPVF